MKRGFSTVLAVLLLCVCCTGCTAGDRARFSAKIINGNLNDITSLAETVLKTGEVPEDAFFEGVETISYTAPNWVDFCTGARDGSPDPAYCGFYYTPEDRPMGYQGKDMELTAKNSGWGWQDPNGGEYYTQRIRSRWFYYEMYF